MTTEQPIRISLDEPVRWWHYVVPVLILVAIWYWGFRAGRGGLGRNVTPPSPPTGA